MAGSIFLDYRNDLEVDDFSIIYGHRMSYGGMFTDLTKYEERIYFDAHVAAEIYVGGNKYDLDVVAFAKVSASNRNIYNLQNEAAMEVFKSAKYKNEVKSGRFVLLSTCDAKDKSLRDVLLLRVRE